MSSHGVGTYKINSFWESGRLIFYEKAYGHTTTGNVFILGHDYVQVGDTANAVNFAWKGTTTGTFTLDAAAHTLAMTGVATSTNGAVTISNATASTTTGTGALIVSGGVGIALGLFVGEVVSVGTVCQPDTSDGAALGTTSLQWSDLFLASTGVINWANGNALLTHTTGLLTFSAGNVAFGVDATGVDVTFFGDTTLYKAWFDQNGDTNGAWYFGADDYGIDVGFYGQTASNSMIWDASANALVFTAGGITMGVTSKLVLPVKASGSTTAGDFWLDTTDNQLHFYNGTAEYTVTAT